MISSKKRQLKWIYTALLVLLAAGAVSFLRIESKNDRDRYKQELINRGNHLVSLMALFPVNEYEVKKDMLLKTLSEHFLSQGLVYCFVQDISGKNIISLESGKGFSNVPADIRLKSGQTAGLLNQEFNAGKDDVVYEFSKPVYQDGKRSAVVRLGFLLPGSKLFSVNYINCMGIAAFLLLGAVVLLYYGAALVLQPVRSMYNNIRAPGKNGPVSCGARKSGRGLLPVVKDLEESYRRVETLIRNTEADNMEMTTRLGVVSYEKKQISKVVDSIDTGIIIIDMRGSIININNYALNLFKKDSNEVLEQPVRVIIGDERLLDFIEKYSGNDNPLESGSMETAFPETAPDKFFRVTLAKLKEDENTVLYNMISLKDITVEKSIKEASQGFIAQVAHELLTPLTTIRSYNEMLMDGEVDDSEMQKEFYNTINDETGRLTRLIQNLLSIAKLEMGGLVIRKGLVKTDWLVEDTVSTVEGEAVKKSIIISRNLPDIFPSILGDKELLKIAIINILGNAVKYCPENSNITLTLLDQTKEVHFIIEDDGPGIAKEDLPHIFEKFYRSNDPDIKDKIGSGLGLAMTAEIINLHSGGVDVESEQGEGTRFTIKLPKEQYYVGSE